MAKPETTTLSSEFQITLPKTLLANRQWQPGQEFAFIPKEIGVLLVPIPSREELAGIARGANPEDYRDR
jgi:bifunctional DNA-binding transcriptional regulator/antitoxin component of YhaV-PrlF toxin-antitoxin module